MTNIKKVYQVPSEVPELHKVLTNDLYLQPGTSELKRNAAFFNRLKKTRAYARNQEFRALVDHLVHYNENFKFDGITI